MRYYKLTDENNKSYGDTTWGIGITHVASGTGANLCSEDVIHVYDHPLKAALFNPFHAGFLTPVLWECRVKRVVAGDGLKVGVKKCTTIRQVPLPKISTAARVHFAILVAKAIYSDPTWNGWADAWLSGQDRTLGAAQAAAWTAAWTEAKAAAEAVEQEAAAWTEAKAAAQAAAQAAARAAAWTAAWTAARTAAWTEAWTEAKAAAWTAAWAVEQEAAAWTAARTAAWAAQAVARAAAEAAHVKVDFVALAKRAIKAEAKP